MAKNKEKKWEDMTLKSLEAKLLSLPQVQVPDTLEQRLLAAIPEAEPAVREYQPKWHPKAWDFGATAAATVLILALIFMLNYGLSAPLQGLPTELNDTSLCYAGWERNNFLFRLYDQNNAVIEDTNYTNYNGRQ